MELIPILSLIILVATISTFILAVGAYVLYKVRERKGRAAKAKPPETIPAELVEPTPVVKDGTKTGEHSFVTGERTMEERTRPTLFGPSTGEKERRTSTGQFTKPTFITQPTYAEDHYKKRRETSESDRKSTRSRFTRYTGEIEPGEQKEKKKREDNLQWR